MGNTDWFRTFDTHVRRVGLGGGVSEKHTEDDYVAYLGQWFYVSHWSCTDDNASTTIQSVISEAASRSKPVMWRIYEEDSPATLEDTLKKSGFKQSSEDTLLVFDLDQPIPKPRYGVVQVRSEHELDQFLSILSAAFDEPMNLPAARRKALQESDQVLSFYSSNDGDLLAAGQMDITEDQPVVLLRGGCTVPQQRGKGGYASMVWSRLTLAREQGKRLAFVEAMPSSRPILLHLGFEEVCSGKTWTYKHEQ